MIHSKPSRMPTTSTPSSRPRMVAALITLLMPGAGPPPTRIASLLVTATMVAQPFSESRQPRLGEAGRESSSGHGTVRGDARAGAVAE